MNILTLKAIAWDEIRKGFFSPSHRDFLWKKEVIARSCDRCVEEEFSKNCTCGIYTSPNPQCLDEYAKFKNSVYVLMNIYGWVDLWTGPDDLPNTWICRTWGTQIVGVVGTTTDSRPQLLPPQRNLSANVLAELFEVQMYPWAMAKTMIEITWKKWLKFDPYEVQTEESLQLIKETLKGE